MASMSEFSILVIFVTFVTSSLGQKIAVTYNLRENQENGTFVGNVARDSLLYGNISESEFQRLKFTFFTQGNPHAKLFKIDEESSTIRTAKVLDREAICILETSCIVTLDIAIYMKDPVINDYDLYKLIKANVIIDDVNDNSPMFPRPRISLSVPESVPVGHVLLTSGAIDEDMGENNSIQSYDLIPSTGMFGLKLVQNWDGSSDLGIVVKYQLDRETKDRFQVKVIAKDGGYPVKTGSVIIDITVTDVNDNRPVFLNNAYNISLYENIPYNRTVLQLSAIDTDDGINSVLSYRYSSRVSPKIKQAFNIDSNSGRIYAVGKIDYEDTKQYQFMVEALDGGSPSLSSRALFTIEIKDENDNVPQININLTPEGTSISEAVDTKKFVAHVSVSDKDTGRNSRVQCTMSDSHFLLESFFDNSYKIVLGKKLDRETQATHNVTITCQDNGRVPLVNSSSFLVHVLDENDNFPEFSQTLYSDSIIENNEIGEEVLRVSAHDRDIDNNGRVSYSIDTDAAKYFSIDQDSGIITANIKLDREVLPEYMFHVIATDHGNQPKAQTVNVIITVLDQNDQPPKFTKPVFFCYVMENLNPGAPAGGINAIDNDTKANGELLYSIPINSWARDFFEVHPRTGMISTKKKFDRESNDQYSFPVNVRDPQVPGFSDSANVTVYILDDNDNLPIIEYPTATNFTTDVPFETTVGSVLAVVKAHDDDELTNAKLNYMLKSGNIHHLFNMNRITGELALSRGIRSQDSGLYKLEIMVSDSGNPPMDTRTKLFVNVAKSNGTLFGSDDSSDTSKNILIVVTIIVVTLILGIAIVTTICLIKKVDRERQQGLIMVKTEEEKMYAIVKKQDSFSSKESDEKADKSQKRNNLKDVRFSIEDDGDENTTRSSDSTSFSTFKSQHSKITHCIPVNNELSPPTSINKQWNSVKEEEARKLVEILKIGEDIVSESSGETGTSDSGRGGSDEEVSHRDDDSQQFHPKSFYPNCLNRGSLSVPHGQDKSAPIFRYNGNTHRGSNSHGIDNQDHCYSQTSSDVFEDSYNKLNTSERMHNPTDYKHHSQSLEFIHGESFRMGTSSYCDDDVESSTSGSYTINPDELQSEINELFFNDVVV